MIRQFKSVRTPTLDDLALDLTAEAAHLAGLLNNLFTSHYMRSGNGKVVTISCRVVENRHVGEELVDWVRDLLAEPRFAFRSYFRDALELIARKRTAFKTLKGDRPHAGEILALVGKHLKISRFGAEMKKRGCGSVVDLWNQAVEPLILILLLPFVDEPSDCQINHLRLFAARCAEFETADQGMCEVFERFCSAQADGDELLELQTKFRDILTYYYANDYEKDPSYSAVVEMGFHPLERLCDPTIDWPELCEVTYHICSSLKAPSTTDVVDLLRETLPCPWHSRIG
ncbi:MAG: hypothetical protein ACRD3W_22410 [Terriglobales bacterium]